MFDHASYGLEAKNARILERVYHKGNKHAWDGKQVLDALIETHGVPSLDDATKQALGRVFSIIMWGELAAWKISAELADELEPFEAKMAATNQAFDEARHFYVMHDYLNALGYEPEPIHKGAKKLLESVMNADNLAKKLLGMQLMVEPVALTLFHVIKELDVEPVLTALMPYYERDEARHVALGLQYLPALLKRMSVRERLELFAYQFRLLNYEVFTNYYIMRDLDLLNVPPRKLIDTGKAKQFKALEEVFSSFNMSAEIPTMFLDRWADTLTELTMPTRDESWSGRLRRTWDVLRHGQSYDTNVPIVPTITDSETPLIHSTGKGRVQRNRSTAA